MRGGKELRWTDALRAVLAALLRAVRFLYGIASDRYADLSEGDVWLRPNQHDWEALRREMASRGPGADRATCLHRAAAKADCMQTWFGHPDAMHVKIFRPRAIRAPEQTCMVVHGLCASGYADERVLQLARALASAGFTVAVPRIAPLENCEIGAASTQAITAASLLLLRLLGAQQQQQPNLMLFKDKRPERIAYAAACISAGMCILAAAQPCLRGKVSAMLLVGTYANVETVVHHVMDEALLDDYGRNAMFLNYMHVLCGRDQNRDALFRAALNLNHYQTQDKHASVVYWEREFNRLCKEHPQLAEQFLRIQRDAAYRQQLAARLCSEILDELEALSPSRVVQSIAPAALCMMHGASDCVVPSSESALLHCLSSKAVPPVRSALSVTTLIDHGTKQTVSIRAAAEVLELLRVVYLFCKAVASNA
ncbi:hypothetical protein FVE85_4746 [Porphyridium purpureum]|uniref:Serine aminopeptidase S33 domain-containing protein n=1 Tax=Porphyridium purpureum TaxID=35688 RepID=A0A5J4YQ85_PORPP|nr:hypothetical protein FVE85_4746 [Porphyridium purpureum]|eukprot:POR2190..scf236_6